MKQTILIWWYHSADNINFAVASDLIEENKRLVKYLKSPSSKQFRIIKQGVDFIGTL